jgi:hypothetical protein
VYVLRGHQWELQWKGRKGWINGYALPNLNVEWRSNEIGSRCVRGGEENPGGREQGWKIHGGGDEG